MPEPVRKIVGGLLDGLSGRRSWRPLWYRLRSLGRCLSGQLVLGHRVRLYAPLRCDGSGRVFVGARTKLGWPAAPRYGDGTVMLQARSPEAVIRIGEHCALSNNVSVIAMRSVEIGQACLIGELVTILDSDFHGVDPERRRVDPGAEPVRIEDNVWLGSRVIVQKGVTIGANSVVAAGAVVTSAVPPNVIVAGVPARVVRSLSETSS